ncbi:MULTISPECIES: hypothetical protein [unclassified Streptomyces]|uniref:hypothetical protein n=1 Tax=unclassified Streptomyces TaxID=2593676 RepID=UPI00382011D6
MNTPDGSGAAPGRAREAERFLALSVALTGFDATELAATGMAETYRAIVLQRLGSPSYRKLVDALADLSADLQAVLDEDAGLRDLARPVCHLWYLGVWPGPPGQADWPAPGIAARAYAHGLVWRSFGGHAPGVGRPGHGSWAQPPAAVAGGRR